MSKAPKPEADEVNAVDAYFKPPKLPRMTIAEKRKFLAILNRVIARFEFVAEEWEIPVGKPDVDAVLAKSAKETRRRIITLDWLYKMLDSQHPVEHMEIKGTEEDGVV